MTHRASSLGDLSLFVSHQLTSLGSCPLKVSGWHWHPLCMSSWMLRFTTFMEKSQCPVLKTPGGLISLQEVSLLPEAELKCSNLYLPKEKKKKTVTVFS